MSETIQIESNTKVEVDASPVYLVAVIIATAIVVHGCMTMPAQRCKDCQEIGRDPTGDKANV